MASKIFIMVRDFTMKKKLFCIFTTIFICTSAPGYDRITGLGFASRSEVIAQNGMAYTSQPLATQVALDILKKGRAEIVLSV